jgi:hypothetical protein
MEKAEVRYESRRAKKSVASRATTKKIINRKEKVRGS